jgi:hypothetical protein
MRLPTYQIPDLDQIEEMRPRRGDTVTHCQDEELYVVDEVGMRFLVCHKQGNPSLSQTRQSEGAEMVQASRGF